MKNPSWKAAMAALFGHGHDPLTGRPLGRAYPVMEPVAKRVQAKVDALSAVMDAGARQAAAEAITRV